jgi:hypothetical protein
MRMPRTNAHREAPSRSNPSRRRRKKSIVPTIAMTLVLCIASFALGWYFGVDSTKYKGSILLICHEPDFYADIVSAVWDCTKWTTKII